MAGISYATRFQSDRPGGRCLHHSGYDVGTLALTHVLLRTTCHCEHCQEVLCSVWQLFGYTHNSSSTHGSQLVGTTRDPRPCFHISCLIEWECCSTEPPSVGESLFLDGCRFTGCSSARYFLGFHLGMVDTKENIKNQPCDFDTSS